PATSCASTRACSCTCPRSGRRTSSTRSGWSAAPGGCTATTSTGCGARSCPCRRRTCGPRGRTCSTSTASPARATRRTTSATCATASSTRATRPASASSRPRACSRPRRRPTSTSRRGTRRSTRSSDARRSGSPSSISGSSTTRPGTWPICATRSTAPPTSSRPGRARTSSSRRRRRASATRPPASSTRCPPGSATAGSSATSSSDGPRRLAPSDAAPPLPSGVAAFLLARAWRRRAAGRCVERTLYPPATAAETTTTLIEAGRAALARGTWGDARARFAEALAAEESPEAYEGLGVAARYELDAAAAIDAHERGYRLARSHGDDDTAARLAVQLAYDAYTFRGLAEAQGWIERAGQLVQGRAPSLASPYVPYIRGYLALLGRHDPETARAASAEALELARAVGAVDVEMLALALEGLALVSSGAVDDGMRRLDAAAAAAVGGEMTDADSIETVCCLLIDACKRVRDLERAQEWCLRVR